MYLRYIILFLLLDIGIFKTITNAIYTGKHSISQQEQLSRINNYEIVQPYRLHGRDRRDVSTITEDGHLKSSTFIIPTTNDREFILDVNLNENLFPENYVVISYLPNEQRVVNKPHSKHHCYYHGTVRDSNSSTVAIDTCSGISGIFVVDFETFYIEPFKDSTTDHLIYKPEDVQLKKKFIDDTEIFKRPEHEEHLEILQTLPRRQKRDAFTETKFIELAIVADNAEFTSLGSVQSTEERCKKVANIMDVTYKPLNIRVALTSVTVWNEGDQIIFDEDAAKTMGAFQAWRKDNLKHPNDNAQFMTGRTFEGSTVGMASLGSMCSIAKSAGVNEDHATDPAGVASTMSHEMGHNLGFYHDASGCQCDAPTGCVMGPSAGSVPPTVWSECTKEYLKTSLGKGLASCLFNYPKEIFDGPICGNGYVEKGEECDCGSVEYCNNPCCVPEICMLHENATCAIGECCDNCQIKPPAELCRPQVNECDLPEYCTGKSEDCPSNVYIQNGDSCMNQKDATCYDGQCITYNNMCKTLWGDVSKQAYYKCYDFNTNGLFRGNCGAVKNGDDETYIKCAKKDIMCGKLFCEGGPTYPIIGSLVRSQVLNTYDENFNQHECKVASVDFGEDVPDPGLVVDGAPCGPNSICSNFQCKNLTDLGIKPCNKNCYGRGVCNSNNNCHCDSEWGPPNCRDPGYGGSIDSGPARLPEPITSIPFVTNEVETTGIFLNVTNEVDIKVPGSSSSTVIIIVMLLVVLPIIGLLATGAYIKREVIAAKWKNYRNANYKRPKPSSNTKQLRKPVTSPGQPLSIEHKVPLAQGSYSDTGGNSGYSSGYSSKHSSGTSATDIPSYPMNFSPATATVEFAPVRPAPARPAPSKPPPAKITPPKPTPPKPTPPKPTPPKPTPPLKPIGVVKPVTPVRPYPPPSTSVKPSVAPRTSNGDSSWRNRVPPKLPALKPTYPNTNNSNSANMPISPIKPPPPVRPPPPNIANKPKVLPKPANGRPQVQIKPKIRPRSSLSSPPPPPV
ncbi:zinc metalloproteinase-disintegrin-like MTP8 isoform X2 [Antedon mediterranea]|uniref:zinc metalloproteinase-disintegrin-like MTP8 isoform X2 n=1 Tax=Antedon mediterranea TaxID=105859 RepID=UPI003AF82F61